MAESVDVAGSEGATTLLRRRRGDRVDEGAEDTGETVDWQRPLQPEASPVTEEEGSGADAKPLQAEASAPLAAEEDTKRPAEPSPRASENVFECNICLDTAEDAVVSLCGHLYCWPCLYRWLELHGDASACPVCKASISREKVVPIYGRASGSHPRDPRNDPPPPRPAGRRTEPPVPPGYRGDGGWAAGGLFSPPFGFGPPGGAGASFTVGVFPGLFGLQFATFPLDGVMRHRDGQPMNPEEHHRAILSRIVLILGVFILLSLLFTE